MTAAGRTAAAGGWVLGVDSGGSGLRVALARAEDGKAVHGAESPEPVRTGPSGIDAGQFLERLLPTARDLLARSGAEGAAVDAVAVGAAGMASLGGDLRATLPRALAESLGAPRLALAADAVTAYAGALGQAPGAVVAAGTGMIALGTALDSGEGSSGGPDSVTSATSGSASGGGGWRRADGWGHLLGDSGGGAWIGRAGLEAALRAYDGRRGGSPALLTRLESLFGPAPGLPALLYPRPDRPAVLASFAPEVGRCAAEEEDPVSAGILRSAAGRIAEAAEAVCPPVESCPVALTGGLFRMGEPLLAPLRERLADLLPRARPTAAAGDPLDGALCIAAALATDRLRLPTDGHLLHLP